MRANATRPASTRRRGWRSAVAVLGALAASAVALAPTPASSVGAPALQRDPDFGTAGISDVPARPVPVAMDSPELVRLPDGRSLLATRGNGVTVQRFLANGSPDASFATSGTFELRNDPVAASGAPDGLTHLLPLPDGSVALSMGGSTGTRSGVLVLDPAGHVVRSFGANGFHDVGIVEAVPIARQASGKLLVQGGDGLQRLDAQGATDTTFGTDGFVTQAALALLVDADRPVQVANSADGTGIELRRYTVDGAVDSSFGTNGTLRLASGVGEHVVGRPVRTGDGGVAMVTAFGDATAHILKLHSDWSVDTGFGTAGRVSLPAAVTYSDSLVATNDGGVAIGGAAAAAAGGWDPLVRRYDSTGAPVQGFGAQGAATVPLGVDAAADALSTDGGDGVLAIVGTGRDMAIAHLDATGARIGGDAAGHDLVRMTPLSSRADVKVGAAVADPQGRVVVASQGFVDRLRTDGHLDTTFGDLGWMHDRATPLGEVSWEQVAIDGSGRIVVAGYTPGHVHLPIVARLGANGVLDSTFGVGGFTTLAGLGTVNVPLASDRVVDGLTVLADGRVVLATTSLDGSGITHGNVVRLSNTGVPDGAFAPGGVRDVSGGDRFDGAALARTASGFTYVGARVSATFPATYRPALVPLAADGTPASIVLTNDTADDLPVSAVAGGTGVDVLVGRQNGSFRNASIVRLSASGTVDPSVGHGGTDVLDLAISGRDTLTRARDGSLLLTHLNTGPHNLSILHLGRDGRPDPAYSQGNGVALPFAAGGLTVAVAARPDGSLVAVLGDYSTAYGGFAFQRAVAFEGAAASYSGWSTVGGYLTGAPAVVGLRSGFGVFVRGGDGQVWDGVANGGWSGWAPMGGGTPDGPAASTRGSGSVDVFIRGLDDAVWQRTLANGALGPWSSLGGGTLGSPASVSWSSDRIDVLIVGLDHQLWQRTYATGGWSGWTALGGYLSAAPSVTSTRPGNLEVAARGGDGAIWQRSYDDGTWSPWIRLGGGSQGSPAIVARPGGSVDVYLTGLDDQLWVISRALGTWSGFSRIGGLLTAGPGAAAAPGSPTSSVLVAVDGADHGLWLNQASYP